MISRARGLLSTYEDMAELIRLGAYKRGSDSLVDEAIRYYPELEALLTQGKHERSSLEDGYAQLSAILGEVKPEGAAPPPPDDAPGPEEIVAARGQ